MMRICFTDSGNGIDEHHDDDATANYVGYAKCIKHYLMRQIILNGFHKNVFSTFHRIYDPYYIMDGRRRFHGSLALFAVSIFEEKNIVFILNNKQLKFQ